MRQVLTIRSTTLYHDRVRPHLTLGLNSVDSVERRMAVADVETATTVVGGYSDTLGDR